LRKSGRDLARDKKRGHQDGKKRSGNEQTLPRPSLLQSGLLFVSDQKEILDASP
jgi:hypothetical protein